MLLAAARLRIGSRRLRALAAGDSAGVREFVSSDSAPRLTEARRAARADAATLERLGGRLVAMGSVEYPRGLLDLPGPPAFLCVRGRLPVGGIAIVGSRDASEAAERFAFDLARLVGRPIVSGLARGIDAAAHRGALAASVDQVAYVGTGLARTYPPEHVGLAEELVAGGGAIASERLPDEGVTRWALTQRDRLQAAHAVGVVLIESEVDGGAMHTLRFARGLGRLRFVLDIEASGNRAALGDGATPLSSNVSESVSIILRNLLALEELP